MLLLEISENIHLAMIMDFNPRNKAINKNTYASYKVDQAVSPRT